ncbi:MAG: hypothetical protein JWO36_4681 [Myxococcales bacterium]|nr:hypothetical protein [Myxococcales bacterium]
MMARPAFHPRRSRRILPRMRDARLGAVLAMVLVLTACKPKPDSQADCLALPGANRSNLVSDPNGGGLYWFEPVYSYSYDAELRGYKKLVRYDLETKRVETVQDHVEAPIRFIGSNLLVRRVTDHTWLALVNRDGVIQSLTPDFLGVLDFELIDRHTIALLADGDGPRAVYTLDLDRPRPHHLIDATSLLSTSHGKVFVMAGHETIGIDPATGKRDPVVLDKPFVAQGDDAWYVSDSTVHARSLSSGQERIAVPTKLPWKLVYEADVVLARTSPERIPSHASLLRSGAVIPLPLIRGGSSILEATIQGDQTWALIGHNTANYNGDLADRSSETEVCRLPNANDLWLETRAVPKRFLTKRAEVFAALQKISPRATLQLLDNTGYPTTVYIELAEPGGDDLALMRARVRDVHRRVSSILEEREIRTFVRFSDQKSAMYRWRRYRLSDRPAAGMGNVFMTDAADFEVELRNLKTSRVGTHILCSGDLVNTHERTLENLEVQCITGDRKRRILVPPLDGLATYHFAHTLDAQPEDQPGFQVFRGREPIETRDAAFEARMHRIYDIGTAMYADSQLAIQEYNLTDDALHFVLDAPIGFDKEPEDVRAKIVAKAYRQFETLRDPSWFNDDLPLTLRIEVTGSSVSYDFDGTRLSLVE